MNRTRLPALLFCCLLVAVVAHAQDAPATLEQTGVVADSLAQAEPPPPPLPWTAPAGVTAADTPNDGGKSITVRWSAVNDVKGYRIERSEPGGEFAAVDEALANAVKFADESVEDGKTYLYRVVALGPAGEEGVSAPSGPAIARPHWFNRKLSLVLISILAFMGLTVYFVRVARTDPKKPFIRRIAGLEAVDEAVGRATEMGRPVLFLTGTGDIDSISTIASLNVLGEISKKTAEYGTTLRVPNCRPIVYTVAREVVKGAYTEKGRPDAYDPDSVFFLVENILAYATAVCGIMSRDKPAANFLLGTYGGESLILAETGAGTGAIQIAGTDSTTQLPFFVVACDYTLIGEELYAASAYLSREPLSVGALKGQDWGKFVFMVFLVVATVLALGFGVDIGHVLDTSTH